MATDDVQRLVTGQSPAPANFTIPGNGQMRPKAIYALFTGTSAGTPYLPALKITSDSGKLVGIYPTCASVAAGGSAGVSWFPGVKDCCTAPTTAGGSGTITQILSPGGTLSVTGPNGPTTSLDLPASGVTAATYGDGAHVSQVQVNAEGIVTAASDIAISGSVGGMVNLFDQTLNASAASIDTGAGGIPSGYVSLLCHVTARSDGAFFSGGIGFQFNNDSAANYDYIWTDQSNTVVSGNVATGQSNTKVMEGPGASIGANRFGVATVTIPAYTDTTAYKACTSLGGFSDGSVHGELVHAVSSWNNTAAITRIKMITGIGNFIAGTRLTIWGLR